MLQLHHEDSGPEWCISSMLYSRDIPFWSGTLAPVRTAIGGQEARRSPRQLKIRRWLRIAVTHAIQWLASQCDAQITHAIILTDLMNLLQNVKSETGCPEWHTAMGSLRLQSVLWIYCPRHAGVSGNERADRLASTVDITSGLQLGLRNFLNMDRPEDHSTDLLKERGEGGRGGGGGEKGSGRHSTLQGRERSVFNQANIGTVSRATLGRLPRGGTECVWAFPRATMPSETETETGGIITVTLHILTAAGKGRLHSTAFHVPVFGTYKYHV